MVVETAGIDKYVFCDGALKDVRAYIDQLIGQYGEDATVSINYWDYEDWDLVIEYERLETEKEAEKRVRAALKARERKQAKEIKQEEAERKELTRLLKKYGSD